ncbi:endonuclease/exonuclease/phosphatase family protein [Pararhodobacter sp. SW119]|uniref:endonuclease/exonuclease/phosphatase family protein n=1 Tax=Pararhodobacter sp. SW119 TaxID=2780075 RepID=UPI001FD854A6|nr:endonuclease/exonuclease/phosphatase family protein [Pararhodobacter sp. SW119]
MRLAVLNSGLGRDGPGLLLRDIRRDAPDVLAVRDLIAAARPDVLLLLRIDYDLDGVALGAFAERLAEAGHPMPHRFAIRPNSGLATGLDLDGDGRLGTPDDAQGYGRFAGAGGMAILSRLPFDDAGVRDHSGFLWRDLPGALLPEHQGRNFPSEEVFAIQRLSSTGHWQVPIVTPAGTRLSLLAWHAGPPVFGGPHARNRRRNHDETAFWHHLLDDALPMPPPDRPFVVIGNANLDPSVGDGIHAAIRNLLAHPALQDPAPTGTRPGADGADRTTAYWPRGPGAMRVSYILPSRDLQVLDSGTIWPDEGRHALVWVDIALP